MIVMVMTGTGSPEDMRATRDMWIPAETMTKNITLPGWDMKATATEEIELNKTAA
jgi:hypothetical protein